MGLVPGRGVGAGLGGVADHDGRFRRLGALAAGSSFPPRRRIARRPRAAGFGASFGLTASAFTFVGQDHFLARNLGKFAAPAPQAAALFKSSTPVNNYSVAGGRILNAGVSAAQIAAATRAPVTKLTVQEVSSPDAAGGKVVGKSLAVFRPNVAAPAVRSSSESPIQPVLINKTPRPSTAGAGTPGAGVARKLLRLSRAVRFQQQLFPAASRPDNGIIFRARRAFVMAGRRCPPHPVARRTCSGHRLSNLQPARVQPGPVLRPRPASSFNAPPRNAPPIAPAEGRGGGGGQASQANGSAGPGSSSSSPKTPR